MSKKIIKTASAAAVFKHVFGFQPGQGLSSFVSETKSCREDAAFVEEVRNYALANAAE